MHSCLRRHSHGIIDSFLAQARAAGRSHHVNTSSAQRRPGQALVAHCLHPRVRRPAALRPACTATPVSGSQHAPRLHQIPALRNEGCAVQLLNVFLDALRASGEVRPGDITAADVNAPVLWFVGLGVAALVASFLEVSTFMWSGTRQVARLRRRYLEAALHQEQVYYETQATSGDVLSGLNDDCQAVQNAISEKVTNAVHNVGAFVAAIAIALAAGWQLALVMMALLPLIAVAGAAFARVLTRGAAVLSRGYADANVTSSQAIQNIRTVASFSAEEAALAKYRDLLARPRRLQVRVSAVSGVASGVVSCVVFLTCALSRADRTVLYSA
jgi:ATP-binding cassette, subfamily B (MDR/TAP), member 1